MRFRLPIPALFLPAAMLLAAPLHANPGSSPDLRASFQAPGPDTRPGCYWYWINDNVSKEGISKDLEAMARVGIGRAYIGHIYNRGERGDTPVGKVAFMSDAWWEALQWAVKEADRCGVEIGFFNSPGWSQSGGPWVKPSQSMRYLAASEIVIEGGRRVEQALPIPKIETLPMSGGSKPVPTGDPFTSKDFQDVRVIAFPQPETETNDLDMAQVKASSTTIEQLTALTDNSSETSVKIGPKARHIDFEVDGTLPVQSVRIHPSEGSHTLTCIVSVSDDGQAFREIARHVEPRGHQGSRNKDPILVPFPPSTAKHLRITLSANRELPIAALALSRRAVLGHYVRKQLGETDPSVRPAWDAYLWPSQTPPAPGSALDSSAVVDLTDKMAADGRLLWDAPPGRWVVKRAGMIPIGTQCHPASPEARGLEVDKMNREHVRHLFDGMVGGFLRRTPPADRKALKYVIADSYETGPQNWTDGFLEKFGTRFGYDATRFLPCLDGRVVDSPEVSARFLWDWRRLVAESIAYDYVGGLREVSNENGLTLWLENYGHWGFPSEFLLYASQSDQVGGEFWETGDPRGNVECRAAASGSNIYGRTDVYAEAFTSNRNFRQSPGGFKNYGDWVYGTGINHFILHVYIHQPDERKPGIIQWFGTAFNRHNTWFEQSKSYIDYNRRCSVMLKAGTPVIDVAYYIGENAPSMEGPRDPDLPDGYDFDYINSDVLIHRAKVVDGRVSVPNGPSYAVLVLPKQLVMRPEVAAAIRRLIHDGATVVGPKPQSSPSLAGFPESDTAVRATAAEVWGEVDGKTIRQRKFGRGTIHDGVTLEQVFAGIGLEPDVRLEGDRKFMCAVAGNGKMGIEKHGGIIFKHRSSPAHEIYFLANTSDRPADFTASLRVAGRKPWLWDAVTGGISEATAFTQREGRTLIPLRLAPSESIFVVFGESIPKDAAGSARSNAPDLEPLLSIDGPWTVRFDVHGAPEETLFDSLTDWSKHPDDAIQHYSGTAIYRKDFTLAEFSNNPRVTLDLGNVAVMAAVVVNGREAGTLWANPWRIDIGGFLQPGENTLEIRVTNTWNNRLVGDAAKPADQRQTYVSQPYQPDGKSPLLPAGLLGPVKLLTIQAPRP